jgi:hypothetical protein
MAAFTADKTGGHARQRHRHKSDEKQSDEVQEPIAKAA